MALKTKTKKKKKQEVISDSFLTQIIDCRDEERFLRGRIQMRLNNLSV